MTTLAKKVFDLYESVEEMAVALNESPTALRRAKAAKALPDPRHDTAIVIRARALGRDSVTLPALAQVRALRPDVVLAERAKLIRAFYKAAGGYKAVSAKTGVAKTSLYSNATRGFLNMNAMQQFLALADEIGFELPPEIFTRPPG